MKNNFFEESMVRLLKHEGGYVNDPDDRGGETNYGITKAVALSYGYKGEMRHIPMNIVYAIYRNEYWNKLKADDIAKHSKDLAYAVFDFGVNAGVGASGRLLQRSANVLTRDGSSIKVDGAIGPASLAAITKILSSDEKVFVVVFNALRANHYISITESRPVNRKYIRGWLNRV